MNNSMRLIVFGAVTAALSGVAQSQDTKAPDYTSQAVSGSPDLSVATVKMEGGTRATKLVGAAVFDGANQQLGTVDDLILDRDHKVVFAVVSVGGILGVGGKLVAEPFGTLQVGGDGKLNLPGVTKDALGKMPGFTYSQ